MAVTAASLVVKVGYDGKEVDSGLKGTTGQINSFATNASAATRMASVGFAAFGAGLDVVLGGAVSASANFEQTMSGVAAVSGVAGQQLDQMRGLALQMGKDTQFSAQQAAQAMEELAKGGVSVSDIMGGALAGSLSLAAAGGLGLAQAATVTADALNIFGLKGADAARVADLFAAAANSSSIDVNDVAMAMAQGGQVAAQFGLSIQDTTAAIAAFGSAGLKGSDAGTSMKTALLSLVNPTDKARAVMDQYGLSFFDSSGKMLSFGGIAGQLRDKLSGLTDEQRLATLETIFGTDAIRAASVLYNQGAEGIVNWNEKVGQQGAAADVAKKRMDNLKGSLEQLRGSLETAAIAIGSALTPAIRFATDTLTRLVNVFLSLPPSVQKVVAFVGVGAAIFATLAGAIGLALPVIVAFVGAIGGIVSAIGAPLIPIVALLGGLGAAVVAFAVAWKTNFLGIGDMMNGFVRQVAAGLGRLPGIFKALFQSFKTGDFSKSFGPIITAISDTFGSAAAGKVTIFVSNVLRGLQLLRDAAVSVMQALRGDWFAGQTESVNGFVRTVARFAQLARDAFLTVKQALAGEWVPSASIQPVISFIGMLATSARQLFVALTPLPGLVRDAFAILTGGEVAGGLEGFQARVSAFVSGVLNAVGNLAGQVGAAFLNVGTAFITWLTPIVPQVLAALGQLFVNLVSYITGTGSAEVAGAMTANMPNAFMQWVGPALGPFLTAVGQFFTTLGAFIVASAPAIGAQLQTWGQQFATWVETVAWPWLQPRLEALLANIGSWITGTALPAIGAWLVTVGQAFGDWVTTTAVPYVQRNLPNWIDAVKIWIDNVAWPIAKDALTKIGEAFGDWVTDTAIPWVQSKLPEWQTALTDFLTNTVLPLVKAGLVKLGKALGDWVTETAIPWLRAQLVGWEAALITFLAGAAVRVAVGAIAMGQGLVNGFIQKASELPGLLAGRLFQVVATIAGFAVQMAGAGAAMIQGLISGMGSMLGGVVAKAKEIAAAAVDAAKSALNIKSPSKVMADIGRDTILGFVQGMSEEEQAAIKRAAEIASSVAGAIKAGVEALTALGTFKAPHSDQAGLFAGALVPVVQSFLDSAAQFKEDGLKAAGIFADAAGKVVGVVKNGVDALNALSDFARPTDQAIGDFKFAVEFLVRSLGDSAATMDADFVANAAAWSEGAGKALGILKTGADGLTALIDFKRPTDQAIGAFKFATEFLVRSVGDSAAVMDADFVAAAGKWSEAAGKALALLGNGVKGLSELADFQRPTEQAIGAFKFTVEFLVQSFGDSAAVMDKDFVAAAAAWSDGAGKALAIIGNGVDGLMKLADFVAPSSQAIDQFAAAVAYLVRRFGEVAIQMGTEGVAQAGAFGTAANSALTAAKTGIDAFVALGKLVVPSQQAIDQLLAGVQYTVQRMGQIAAEIGTAGLAQAVAFATAAGTVFTTLKTAIELLGSLEKLKKAPMGAVDELLSGVKGAVAKAGDLIAEAEELGRQAIRFRDAMAFARATFAEGMGGGGGMAPALAGGVAVPAAPPATGGGHTTYASIQFNAPVYGAADFDRRVAEAKATLERRGGW